MTKSAVLVCACVILIALVFAVPGRPSAEAPWHGPDLHSSLPHPAPGSSLTSTAIQPAQALAQEPLSLQGIVAIPTSLRVAQQLEGNALDHPPR